MQPTVTIIQILFREAIFHRFMWAPRIRLKSALINCLSVSFREKKCPWTIRHSQHPHRCLPPPLNTRLVFVYCNPCPSLKLYKYFTHSFNYIAAVSNILLHVLMYSFRQCSPRFSLATKQCTTVLTEASCLANDRMVSSTKLPSFRFQI